MNHATNPLFQPQTMKPILVGIAGGSGSGKTTLSRAIVSALGAENVTYICHDFYYRDLSHLPVEERARKNFDHPDALETSLMVEQLAQLKEGGEVELPTYDFTLHTRAPTTVRCGLQTVKLEHFVKRCVLCAVPSHMLGTRVYPFWY